MFYGVTAKFEFIIHSFRSLLHGLSLASKYLFSVLYDDALVVVIDTLAAEVEGAMRVGRGFIGYNCLDCCRSDEPVFEFLESNPTYVIVICHIDIEAQLAIISYFAANTGCSDDPCAVVCGIGRCRGCANRV